jgi:hypothetical protein
METWRCSVDTSWGDGGVRIVGSLIFDNLNYAISVDMEQWTAEHRVFVVENLFKTKSAGSYT